MLKPKFCSCKLSDKVWGVVNPKSNTLHRLTFSEDLAQWMSSYDESYKPRPFRFVRGKKLEPGTKSKTGLYAIVGTRKDLVLRITLFKDGAEMLTEDDSRHIEEVSLVSIAA